MTTDSTGGTARRRRPRPLVVLRRVIEAPDRPVGAFASVAVAAGRLPGVVSRPLGTFCFDTRDAVVGLTYDDGPHPEHTPRLLDVLAARGSTATFFVMAGRAQAHPGVIRRIVAEGHELALHGADHRWLPAVPTREAVGAIRDARRRVQDVGGVRVGLYRPPYGGITPAQALAVAALGLECVIWTSDAGDWLDGPEAEIAARAGAGAFPGGILLLHDDRADPEIAAPDDVLPRFDRADVLARLLDDLAARGYRAASIADLSARYRKVRSFSRDRVRSM